MKKYVLQWSAIYDLKAVIYLRSAKLENDKLLTKKSDPPPRIAFESTDLLDTGIPIIIGSSWFDFAC